jgi:hypothetical protein
MKTREQNDGQGDEGNVAAPFDDVPPEWAFDTSVHCEPIFFETSVHIDTVFFDTSAQVSEGIEAADANGNAAVRVAGAGPMWEAYQRYGYSIWRFDGADWQVVSSKCAPGAVCGTPPREAGQYVGEHRKKHCEPATDAVHSRPTEVGIEP